MKPIIKTNNNELSFRLKLNYNNVYSRLRMLLGKSNIFADVATKSTATTWFGEDHAEYTSLAEAPKDERLDIIGHFNRDLKKVKKEIESSKELAPYVDDILEVPDENYIFYTKTPEGYKFLLAGWGCKGAHTTVGDAGIIKHVTKPVVEEEVEDTPRKPIDLKEEEVTSQTEEEGEKTIHQEETPAAEPVKGPAMPPKFKGGESHGETNKTTAEPGNPVNAFQHVLIKVVNQNMKPVVAEEVKVRAVPGEFVGVTDSEGVIDAGSLPYHSTFSVTFPNIPNIPERTFEVEPNVEEYEMHIKKYVSYSPVLSVEDQNGSPVEDYNIKVMMGGKDQVYNTGQSGMIQLPMMHEGQKFIVLDTANYANSQEYVVTAETAKRPIKFAINRVVSKKVGIRVVGKDNKPVPGIGVTVHNGESPTSGATDKSGRAEFPSFAFKPGETPVQLSGKNLGNLKALINYDPAVSEYTIQVDNKKGGFDKRWLLLLLLPLLLLLGIAGKLIYDHFSGPNIAEMEKGVGLIVGQGYYYVDINIPEVTTKNGEPLRVYFTYDYDSDKVEEISVNKPLATIWTGTGFIISDDGLIATNKHVAYPQASANAGLQVKKHFQDQKTDLQEQVDEMRQRLQDLAALGWINDEYMALRESIKEGQEQIRILDKIINTGNYTPHLETKLQIAFSGSRVNTNEEGNLQYEMTGDGKLKIDNFVPLTSTLAYGEPGGLDEIDLAIVQIAHKKDLPEDYYVFKIPEKDLLDTEVPNNYEVTLLGYNAGFDLQNLKLQDNIIRPQAQHGKIANLSEKYRIGYDIPTMGGSSGSPVFNNHGELVAIHNSSINVQSFRYGIRPKYLRELLEKVQKKNKDNKTESK